MNTKKIVYVDMDGVLCDFMGRHTTQRQMTPDMKYPQAEVGFFRKLDEIQLGKWGINELVNLGYDVFILTAPSLMNPLSYTEKREWVEEHLGLFWVDRLIISPRKDLNKGDYLIDDILKGKGQDKFEGELMHFGFEKFPTWKEVIEYLKN